MTERPDLETAIWDAQRQLIARRLPSFAAAWLGVTLVWSVALASEASELVPAAVALVAAQTLGAGLVVLFRHRWPTRLAAGAVVVVFGASWTTFFFVNGGMAVILDVLLISLCVTAGSAFAWGWRMQLPVLGLVLGPGLAIDQGLEHMMPPLQSAAALLMGAIIPIGTAEIAARRVRIALELQAREGGDVAARLETEAKLRWSEARFRRLSEANILGIILCDTEGRIAEANDAFLDMVGYAHTAPPSRWDELTPPEWQCTDDHARAQLAATGVAPPWEKEYLHRDGHRVPVLVGVALIEGSATECVAFVLDLTKRKAAERALRASLVELRTSEEKLRRLAQRQTIVREEERSRLGLDLHDDVCQELIGITAMLESARQGVAPETAAHGLVGRAILYIGEVGDHLRGLAHELRPLQLRDLGLEGTLRSLAAGMSSSSTSVQASFPTPIPRLSEDTELGFYRVAQEAVSNAVRHSQAQNIEVVLAADDGRLRLAVRDDGCGFSDTPNLTGALGLASMEERALALGGHLAIQSRPGAGTTIHLDCALPS